MRSGTSVFRRTLDSHPRISAGPEESSLFWFAKADTEMDRDRRQGYGFDDEEWLDMVRRFVEEIYSRYAVSQDKTRWALKLPENALTIQFLNKLYPGCQVIHIIRNPRDVVGSNHRMYGPRKDAMYGSRWVEYVKKAEHVGKILGDKRFRTVRYEDFVSEPEKVMREVIEWLGEPWSEDVLRVGGRSHRFPARLKEQEDGPLAHHADIHSRSIGSGKSEVPIVPMLYVRLKGKKLAERFGYDVELSNRHGS
jgi:hypothetical protein